MNSPEGLDIWDDGPATKRYRKACRPRAAHFLIIASVVPHWRRVLHVTGHWERGTTGNFRHAAMFVPAMECSLSGRRLRAQTQCGTGRRGPPLESAPRTVKNRVERLRRRSASPPVGRGAIFNLSLPRRVRKRPSASVTLIDGLGGAEANRSMTERMHRGRRGGAGRRSRRILKRASELQHTAVRLRLADRAAIGIIGVESDHHALAVRFSLQVLVPHDLPQSDLSELRS